MTDPTPRPAASRRPTARTAEADRMADLDRFLRYRAAGSGPAVEVVTPPAPHESVPDEEQPQRGSPAAAGTRAPVRRRGPRRDIAPLLASRAGLRQALLLQEILGPPKSLGGLGGVPGPAALPSPVPPPTRATRADPGRWASGAPPIGTGAVPTAGAAVTLPLATGHPARTSTPVLTGHGGPGAVVGRLPGEALSLVRGLIDRFRGRRTG